MNHFKTIPYKQISNFREFYYEDKSNIPYFLDWDKILKYHAATGYEGIEAAPWDMTEILALFGTPRAFADFAGERGIAVSGMFHGINGGHIKENHDQCIKEGRNAVDLVESMGGTHLNTCPGSDYYSNGPLTEEGIQNTVDCLNEIGRYAEDHGIHLGIHNEFFCIVNKDNHRRIIESTNSKYVHYCLDTAQIAIIGEDLVEFYEDYHDRICTFHLKDTADLRLPDSVRYGQDVEIRDDGHRWFWEPGMGLLDFPGLWASMKKHGFRGWVTVETDGTPDLLASMALSSYYIKNELGKIYS
jgi:inosose dehydratase